MHLSVRSRIVSGDTFRAFSDHVFEYSNWVHPPPGSESGNGVKFDKRPTIRNGDVIFIHGDDFDLFVHRELFFIRSKFILITHNCDKSFPSKISHFKVLRSRYLIHWFAENLAVSESKKISAIPIGLTNQRVYNERRFGGIPLTIHEEHLRNPPPPFYNSTTTWEKVSPRPYLIYINFSPRTKLRWSMLKQFQRLDAILHQREKEPLHGPYPTPIIRFSMHHIKSHDADFDREYIHDLKQSKFVLSPPGNGMDCYRTWEAILYKSIPIVMNSTLYPLFRDSPVYILPVSSSYNTTNQTSYSDLSQFSEFKSKTNHISRKMLMAQYWFDKIDLLRKPFKYLDKFHNYH